MRARRLRCFGARLALWVTVCAVILTVGDVLLAQSEKPVRQQARELYLKGRQAGLAGDHERAARYFY